MYAFHHTVPGTVTEGNGVGGLSSGVLRMVMQRIGAMLVQRARASSMHCAAVALQLQCAQQSKCIGLFACTRSIKHIKKLTEFDAD